MEFYILTYIGKPIGESGEGFNTEYEFDSACKKCGTGAKIKGSLHSKGLTKINEDFFQTNDGDTIISATLKQDMVGENLKIGKLKNVVDFKGKELPYFHLTSQFMLPKASKIKGLITEGQCSVCKQNGYFNDVIIGNIKQGIPTVVKPVELFYNNVADDLLKLSDIFMSWEHMGLSNLGANGKYVVRFARPLLIVSESIFNFLSLRKIKGIEVERVSFL